jgi:sialate O-acetylesterase
MVLQQQTEAAIWGWSDPGASVTVTTSWNKKKYSVKADAAGKWKLKVSTPVAGGPYSVTISDGKPITINNVLIGEVWLCSGQSNMEMPMKGFRDQPIKGSNDAVFNSTNEELRIYTVPRAVERAVKDTSKTSSWKTANPETISNFSATAYYFGRLLQARLKVPVALIHDSYSGSPAEAFMSAESLSQFPDIKVPSPTGTERLNNKNATTLYNGMIHPLAGYTIKGCIWYQGESNYDRPDQYEKLFPAMVELWRKEWDEGNFPFYFAQIAPYKNPTPAGANLTEKMNSAFLRDAQRKSLQTIPNSGMIVLMDIGEETIIHPSDKETTGKRFAYLALGDAYQLKGFTYQSPMFDSINVTGNVAVIKFRNTANGLTSFGKPVTQFEIAGADKAFHPAQAVIRNGTIVVSSPLVATPVAVRYAFRDFIVGELFNTEGFPVSSFRTDSW